MVDLRLPVILVTAPYLGSISHTLSALEVLEARGLHICAVVVSQPSVHGSDPVSFAEELNRFRDVKFFTVPHGSLSPVADLARHLQGA